MNKNPWMNALAALAYIVAVASFLFYVPDKTGGVDSVLMPIAMLSLFVLSAAVMGYLFLARPFELYSEDRTEAFRFFGKTVGVFAVLTFATLLIVVFAIG